MPKDAEIIAIGSELLTPQNLDTNSLVVTEHLNLLGVDVVTKQVIGDDRARLSEAIRVAVDRSCVVVLIGGLGPTEDDVTREAVADALDLNLVLSLEQESVLISRFRQINRPMAKNNIKQAYLLEGAAAMPNPHGTAPGQFLSTRHGALALLPGPPRELKPMVVNELIPRLKPVLPRRVIRVRTFRITGIGESDLDAMIAPVYKKYQNPATTVLSSPGDLTVILRAQAETEEQADSLLREAGNPIAQLLGDRVYSEKANESLEALVGCLLRKHHANIATAESCTGGLIAARLTELAGSSDFFVAGYVTYTDAQKQDVLGVPKDLIAKHGAVSEPVAAAMAEGARRRTGASYALSATGYAGPDGGTEFNPVGTVYLGIAGPGGTRVVRVRYGGDRYRTRMWATQSALDLLRKTLLKLQF
ncbi:MAG: competence/damage-inducible protein A [Acidobacteriaceae bacterium]|nr:competence/damage-inducible protein A [Acidobacteriaceae bacterium]MBV9763619.1 competence/damage-inducible protein A [Acidobacteriaceae bacterium]